MERPIEDILSENPEPEIVESPEPESITDPDSGIADPSTRLRDEQGRFKAKDETGVEPPAKAAEPVTPTDKLPQAEYAALRDERQKRQQLEAQLEQALGLLGQFQAPQQQVPDMFEDPDGFKAHLVKQIRDELTQELQPAIQQGNTLTRAEVSEMLARQKYEDYDATVEIFKEAMATNPFLLTQLQQSPDPATFAYNAGKQYQAAKSLGSAAPPNAEELKAQLREELMAELGLNRPTAPSTIADGRSVGSRSGPAWGGPRAISDILSS